MSHGNRILKIKYLLISLPLVFVMVFFGYLRLQFDLVVYTDNIVGEGYCDAYTSSPNEGFAHLYEAGAYFGSELKTLRVRNLMYDIEYVEMSIYDISEFDILSYDISIFGRTVTHFNGEGMTHPYSVTVNSAVESTEPVLMHLTIDDPQGGVILRFPSIEFVPEWIWYAYGAFILLLSVLLGLLISVICKQFPKVEIWLWKGAGIMAALIAGAFFCGSLPYVNYLKFWLNWLILYAVSLFIDAITPHRIGGALMTFAVFGWYLANYYTISFRGKPIMPADISAFKTAMDVIDGYNLTPTWQMLLAAGITVVYIIAIILCARRLKKGINQDAAQADEASSAAAPGSEPSSEKKALIGRAITALVSIAIIIFGFNNPVFASVNSFAWDANVLESFHREGIVLSFAKNALNSIVKKPESYSREAVNGYLNDYGESAESEGEQPTKIIMIMNEAFSDLRTVGLDPSVDVMPFVDSLDENVIEGTLFSSVFAGGTCNTEFEALTGNSLAFLGVGAYPYTENITDNMFSLAEYFSGLGFDTEAFHSNSASNWNRNRVYPLIGFSTFHDIEDYEKNIEVDYLHSYPADTADYAFLKKVSAGAGKQFLFDVTMQNHSGYERFEDVTVADTVKGAGDYLGKEAQVYLSLIKASDDAIRELVEYYSSCDERVMLIFFGDHQPGLDSESQSGIYTNLQMHLDYFKTKFFVWTNYETETVHGVELSANYLPYLILERGNFAMPKYVQMLGELYESYPVITSQGVIDAEGYVYDSVADLDGEPLIDKYRNIQYANIFDEISDEWFKVR